MKKLIIDTDEAVILLEALRVAVDASKEDREVHEDFIKGAQALIRRVDESLLLDFLDLPPRIQGMFDNLQLRLAHFTQAYQNLAIALRDSDPSVRSTVRHHLNLIMEEANIKWTASWPLDFSID